MKKSLITLALGLVAAFAVSAQEETAPTNVWRVNFLNPGVEYEMPVRNKSTISANVGIGYGASHPNLTPYASGWLYMIAPYIDLQYKYLYNLQRRAQKGKNTEYNSSNYIGLRMLSRGKALKSNFTRTRDFDVALGPVWGLQRAYGKFHLLFSAGPIYYADMAGKSGFFPVMLELNLGFNLN